MIKNDQEAIDLIKKLYEASINTEEEWTTIIEELEEYVSGCTEIIRTSKDLIDPKIVLKIAREQNKPILI
ncbi:MAG: hypothetical protein FJX18_07540 [Alphaproteobacteria bacterium]|nr:hypothetical protein [Alphaproteobacteria bacterium]